MEEAQEELEAAAMEGRVEEAVAIQVRMSEMEEEAKGEKAALNVTLRSAGRRDCDAKGKVGTRV